MLDSLVSVVSPPMTKCKIRFALLLLLLLLLLVSLLSSFSSSSAWPLVVAAVSKGNVTTVTSERGTKLRKVTVVHWDDASDLPAAAAVTRLSVTPAWWLEDSSLLFISAVSQKIISWGNLKYSERRKWATISGQQIQEQNKAMIQGIAANKTSHQVLRDLLRQETC